MKLTKLDWFVYMPTSLAGIGISVMYLTWVSTVCCTLTFLIAWLARLSTDADRQLTSLRLTHEPLPRTRLRQSIPTQATNLD